MEASVSAGTAPAGITTVGPSGSDSVVPLTGIVVVKLRSGTALVDGNGDVEGPIVEAREASGVAVSVSVALVPQPATTKATARADTRKAIQRQTSRRMPARLSTEA